MNSDPIPMSVPWYETEDDFNTVLSMVPVEESDGALGYHEWVRKIEAIEQERRDAGFAPVRVPIKPAAIKEWCDTAGVGICRAVIAKYATNQMAFTLLRKTP